MTPKIAFIKARWHADIVDQAYKGFVTRHEQRPEPVEAIDVPGAFEMPLLAKSLAETGDYAAIICAALVVDGGIYRHDFVAGTVVDALMKVQLQTNIPVFSVSLTPHNFQEGNPEHRKFFKAHFIKKGAEAAEALAMILDLKRSH